MSITKPVPYSIYDIRGVQEWLDEMALQGLFLKEISLRGDRAVFQAGEPRPVRYRLDPVKVRGIDLEQKELYERLGWRYVDQAPNLYNIYSCGDPSVPELHSDPQTLAYSLKQTLWRRMRRQNLFSVALVLILVWLYAASGEWKEALQALTRWDNPLLSLEYWAAAILFAGSIVATILQTARLRAVCRALDEGLPPKTGRRWNRPPYILILFLFVFLIHFLIPRAQTRSPDPSPRNPGATQSSSDGPDQG